MQMHVTARELFAAEQRRTVGGLGPCTFLCTRTDEQSTDVTCKVVDPVQKVDFAVCCGVCIMGMLAKIYSI